MPEDLFQSILVVDDEPDICDNLRDILADFGYEVDTARDGAAALEKIRDKPYDVALLDLKMPGMDGLQLYRRIKELRAGTVALIVTAYAADETAKAALEAGAWKIVSKPVDFGMLMQFIEEALDQPLVLVVDDDHDLCESLWDLLRERGFRVSLAGDAPQAANQLGAQDYQVVLIDMKLPQGDGVSVFRLVRQTNPKARTVLITGHRAELEIQVSEVIKQGADAVCYKPFNVQELLTTLERLSRHEACRPPHDIGSR